MSDPRLKPPPIEPYKSSKKLSFCIVCSSNQNRSMEGHKVLQQCGFDIVSAGTGSAVRMPGPSADKPNVYAFGTPYQQMYDELTKMNPALYAANGVLYMLDRNRKIKTAPQQFKTFDQPVDVIITCEEKCFDAVCEDLITRPNDRNMPVHVINVEIRDSSEDALSAGPAIVHLAKELEESEALDDEIDGIIERQMKMYPQQLLHAVMFY